MLDKVIKLGVQIVSDELEEAKKNGTVPFDWNIAGLDNSRPAQTRSNGESIHKPEHIIRKIKKIAE